MIIQKQLNAPRDRMIEVHVRNADIWLRVKWDPNGVTDADGLPNITGRWEGREQERASFWLGPQDIDGWREPVYPPLKVAPLDRSPAWDTLAARLLDLDESLAGLGAAEIRSFSFAQGGTASAAP